MERASGFQRVPAVNAPAAAVSDSTPVPRPAAADPVSVAYDFSTFYAESRDALARALAVVIGDVDLAVEAVDEAMARAYQRWAKVSHLESPAGWVYRVGLNWATSVLRRRRRPARQMAGTYPSRPVAVEEPAPAEPSVMAAIAELEVRQRAVVVCRYLLGWSEAQTAAALSTPEGTVKSRLHRANRHLSERLSHLREERY